jgi:nucleoid-associated protein YgaU
MFDHRGVDGVPAARALVRIEAILNTTILEELRTARAAAAPPPAARVETAAYPAKLPANENSPP